MVNHSKQNRRLARVFIAPEALLAFTGGAFEAKWNLPADIQIVAAGYDQSEASFYLLLGSASFGEVCEGGIVPTIPSPELERIDLDELNRHIEAAKAALTTHLEDARKASEVMDRMATLAKRSPSPDVANHHEPQAEEVRIPLYRTSQPRTADDLWETMKNDCPVEIGGEAGRIVSIERGNGRSYVVHLFNGPRQTPVPVMFVPYE